jgi:hypothetical protein
MAKSLYPLKPLVSHLNFLKLFNTCVLSLLKYMVVILGSASRSSIQIIERSIRRSARVILLKDDRILADIYSYLNWFLPIDNYKYFLLCNLFNILRYNNIPYFDRAIVLNSDRACHSSHSTRSTNNIYVPNVRRNRYGVRSFFYLLCLFTLERVA